MGLMNLPHIKVSKIEGLNTIILKQSDNKSFFIASPTAIVISIQSLSFILKSLLDLEILSPKVLEGILEEYNSDKRR